MAWENPLRNIWIFNLDRVYDLRCYKIRFNLAGVISYILAFIPDFTETRTILLFPLQYNWSTNSWKIDTHVLSFVIAYILHANRHASQINVLMCETINSIKKGVINWLHWIFFTSHAIFYFILFKYCRLLLKKKFFIDMKKNLLDERLTHLKKRKET